MIAFATGTECEWRYKAHCVPHWPTSNEWDQVRIPTWNFEECEYRIKPEPPKPTAEDYLRGHRESGLQVGDRVRVTRKAEDYEGGWANLWQPEMDSCVGKVMTIDEDRGRYGFWLSGSLRFPHFVLEKVEPREVWLVETPRWLGTIAHHKKELADSAVGVYPDATIRKFIEVIEEDA